MPRKHSSLGSTTGFWPWVRLAVLPLVVFGLGCHLHSTRERATPPSTHVEMTVAGVATTSQGGKVVMLVDAEQKTVLPIFVGGTEALSIELRLEHQRYQRPLTHDLLDSVMHELHGELQKVQVNELRDNVYIGAVFVRDGGHIAEIDARPSDAIALALGADVPIFVASKVIEAAGVRRDQFDQSREALPGLPGVDPMSL
jgi:uncharacterized protein